MNEKKTRFHGSLQDTYTKVKICSSRRKVKEWHVCFGKVFQNSKQKMVFISMKLKLEIIKKKLKYLLQIKISLLN